MVASLSDVRTRNDSAFSIKEFSEQKIVIGNIIYFESSYENCIVAGISHNPSVNEKFTAALLRMYGDGHNDTG